MSYRSLKDLPVKGKKVLMRVDFNVPLSKEGAITDDSRIVAALELIQYVLNQGAALILISHLGRPKAAPDPHFTLAPIARRLSELLERPVLFAQDCVGPVVEKMVSTLRPGQVLLLENVRFHLGEEEPEQDPSFVKKLALLGDCYVNDAFGTAHRAHSSTALIAKYFPGKSAAGFLMEKELNHLLPLLEEPKRPFYALIGGAKVSTKAGVIHNLLKRVDHLFLGGGMTYTFLKAQGIAIGDSLVEESEIKTAQEILEQKEKVHLPLDLIIADAFSNEAHWKIIEAQEGIPPGWQGMGIGPKTVENWSNLFQKAETIFWNGPVSVFEMSNFASPTRELAE
ncbi:MAG: phosphoglycerate kinase, partial [Chlamydiia bacterium]|nr:phosphoglycerate kinase [Chlamydiia bacterium]